MSKQVDQVTIPSSLGLGRQVALLNCCCRKVPEEEEAASGVASSQRKKWERVFIAFRVYHDFIITDNFLFTILPLLFLSYRL